MEKQQYRMYFPITDGTSSGGSSKMSDQTEDELKTSNESGGVADRGGSPDFDEVTDERADSGEMGVGTVSGTKLSSGINTGPLRTD